MRQTLSSILLFLLLMSCATTDKPQQPEVPQPEKPAPVDPGFPLLQPVFVMEVELPEPYYKHVDLKKLRVGMTKEEVLAIFPDPLEIDIRQTGYEMWQYDAAELYFKDNLLRDWFNL